MDFSWTSGSGCRRMLRFQNPVKRGPCITPSPPQSGRTCGDRRRTILLPAACLDMRELVFKACTVSVWEKVRPGQWECFGKSSFCTVWVRKLRRNFRQVDWIVSVWCLHGGTSSQSLSVSDSLMTCFLSNYSFIISSHTKGIAGVLLLSQLKRLPFVLK